MGGDMRELITAEQANRLFVILAVALPPLGIAIGAWMGARRKASWRGARYGLLVGMLGPVNLLLWFMY